MKIVILDAQRTLFEGVVSEAILPGQDGELSILDEHETIYAALTKGFIRLQPVIQAGVKRFGAEAEEAAGRGQTGPVFINRGLARMKNNELVIIVE